MQSLRDWNFWEIGMLERQIEKKIKHYAEGLGFLTYKFSSPSNRGVPDRVFICPDGRVEFVEFKTSDGRLTELQKHTFGEMFEKGVHVEIVRSIDQGKRVIDNWAIRAMRSASV